MAYSCKDCSYRGKKSGQGGQCPACGSFNVVQKTPVQREKKGPSKWRLVAMLLLWGILISMIIWKLVN